MAQLSFQWPIQPSHDAHDFVVSPANADAVRFLESWPDGQACAALLSGPESSGKTHLAKSWAARAHAVFIDSEALGNTDSQALWQDATHAVLEDIHAIARQTALFHLLRFAELHGRSLLMTARVAAPQLHFALADLRSRLLALPQAAIQAPDEELLKAFLLKGFADRQLRLGPKVMEYLLHRMERSFAAAQLLVERLSAEALAKGRNITIPLARNVLGVSQ